MLNWRSRLASITFTERSAFDIQQRGSRHIHMCATMSIYGVTGIRRQAGSGGAPEAVRPRASDVFQHRRRMGAHGPGTARAAWMARRINLSQVQGGGFRSPLVRHVDTPVA